MHLLSVILAVVEWALVSVPVGTFRAEPRQGAEMETQAPMGTPVQILERNGEWRLTMLPDSVVAWTNCSTLTDCSEDDMNAWRGSKRLVVTSFDETPGYSPVVADVKITSLVNGTIVQAQADGTVRLPDGRTCVVDTAAVMDFDAWCSRSPDIQRMMLFAYSMLDTPYLWGGTSTKMNDCSGFSRICYLDGCGVLLPRNSSWQARTGMKIEDRGELRRGDLLFFTNPATGRVNHVAIYDRADCYIHSSGRVHVSSLDPESPLFNGKSYLHAVRIVDDDGTLLPGIRTIGTHPWYRDL